MPATPGGRAERRLLQVWWIVLRLLTVVCCLHLATQVRSILSIDEASHLAYMVSVSEGVLPTVDTPLADVAGINRFIDRYLAGADDAHGIIWTANHPPLFYLLGVPVVWLSEWTGEPTVLLYGARSVSALAAGGTVILVGLLARTMYPARPAVAALAPALLLVFRGLVFSASQVFNDSLSLFFTTALLLVVVVIFRRGVSTGRLWAAAAVGAAAGLTRSGALPTVVLGALAVCAAAVVAVPAGRRLRAGVRTLLIVGGVPFLFAGWFYLRNLALYGDFTASRVLLDHFGRRPKPRLWEIDTLLPRLGEVWRILVVGDKAIAGSHTAGHVVPTVLWIAVIAVIAIRSANTVVHALRSRSVGTSVDPAWILITATVLFTVIATIDFATSGGSLFARYLLPILPAVSLLLALGWMGVAEVLPPRMRPTARRALFAIAVVVVVAVVVVSERWTSTWLARRARNGPLTLDGFWWVLIAVSVAAVLVVAGLMTARLFARDADRSGSEDASPPAGIAPALRPS